MQCPNCFETIALAKRCPYCGHVVQRTERTTKTKSSDDREDDRERGKRVRGQFRGSVHSGQRRSTGETPGGIPRALTTILLFFLSPSISKSRKWVVLAALIYIISPIDFVPGAVFPIVGWLDDLAVAYFAWQWMKSHVRSPD